MSDAKDFIRAEAMRHRQTLQVHPDWADQATEQFLNYVGLEPGKIVSLYYPKGKELDTVPLAEKLWEQGIEVALPIMQADQVALKFAIWPKGGKLIEGAFGIPVPDAESFVEPDILIVPLLIFDQRGQRLGYGKGHYDATLNILRQKKDVLAVGFAYAEQACLFALPREDHDQKLDLVVTPQRVFDFRD